MFCKLNRQKFTSFVHAKYGNLVGDKIAEVLKFLFAKRSLGFYEYCDFCDSLVNSSDNF